MKKNTKLIIKSLLLATVMIFIGCEQPENAPSNKDGGSTGPDLTTINGTYEYKENIGNKTYVATIKISQVEEDYKFETDVNHRDSGRISAEESPRLYSLMSYTDDDILALIEANYNSKKDDPKSDAHDMTFEQYKEIALKEAKGADGTEYDFSCSIPTTGYDKDIQSFGLDKNNTIVIFAPKKMFGENFYYIARNDFSKLYCYKSYDVNKKFEFKKIK